jgi:hypothetical protein
MAADDVAAAVEFAQLRLGQKPGCADAVRGDEEMASPAAAFKQVRDGVMEAHAAIVEGEQDGAPFELANGADRQSGSGDGIEVANEILAAQFVDVGAFARETAGFEIAVFHNVVVHDGKRLHGVSSY